jgi:hypothetical protein
MAEAAVSILMARSKRESNQQRLTLFLPEGAVTGRALEFHETGMLAEVDAEVPPYERHSFTLHLPGKVLSGETVCLGQEERVCRLQFSSLTEDDRAHLEPLMSPET